MITTVLFDMGGTLEDIWVDEQSETAAIAELDKMLKSFGLETGVDLDALRLLVKDGWKRYGAYRDSVDVELKPVEIWCDYILSGFNFPREILAPHCEEIAHMWEITYYHRLLRPRVAEMLDGLKGLGLKLGVISNTAALFQVFDSLEEYGIRDYFKDVTLSSVTGMRKPSSDIFTVSIREMQSAADECVYVGDTLSRDVIGSKRAGFAAAIQIGSKLTAMKDADTVHEFEPDVIIKDIYDVYPVVKQMIGA